MTLLCTQLNIDIWVQDGERPRYVTASKVDTERRILLHMWFQLTPICDISWKQQIYLIKMLEQVT